MSISLRPYQQELVDKFTNYKNVLIADEMGLGKTYAAIALDQVRYEQASKDTDTDVHHKTLVVAPLTGVVDSWVTHYQAYDPSLRVYRIGEKPKSSITKRDREKFIWHVQHKTHDVYVVHYEAMRAMPELRSESWNHVIADEVHKIKNKDIKQTKALKDIKKVRFKTGLTGTPMVNYPHELWSILDWMYKSSKEKVGFFGPQLAHILNSYWRFYATFLEYEIIPPVGYRKITGTKNEEVLRSMIDPVFIRRTKKDAMPDLPDKQYSEIKVDLHPSQRRQYNDMKDSMVAWLETQDGDRPLVATAVIAKLQRLQQFAVATPHLSETVETHEDYGAIWETVSTQVDALTKPSAKLDALVELVSDAGGKQIVVFSQFRKMIDLCYDELTKKGYDCVRLTGQTPQQDRTDVIKRFQSTTDDPKYRNEALSNEAPQVFLATIRAGGQGIDLFASDTVVFLDRAWSPADNAQAEDRLHRGGQKGNVQVIDIIARNTIDQHRSRQLKMKKELVRNILEAGNGSEHN